MWNVWSADHNVQAELPAKIAEEIEQLIRKENNFSDATDGTFDILSDLAEFVQQDFGKLIDADSAKKCL